jgi:hypothetical protein
MCQLSIATFGTTCPWVTMNLETEKMIEINQIKPTSIPHTSDELRPAKNHLTVKAAAQRLRKSMSTVYRIDRKNGPFRFVIDGRRVFIDAESFAAYLAGIGGIPVDDGREVSECLQPAQEPAELAGAPSVNGAMETESASAATPTPPVPASSSEGQRDLIIRQRKWACGVLYQQLFA